MNVDRVTTEEMAFPAPSYLRCKTPTTIIDLNTSPQLQLSRLLQKRPILLAHSNLGPHGLLKVSIDSGLRLAQLFGNISRGNVAPLSHRLYVALIRTKWGQ